MNAQDIDTASVEQTAVNCPQCGSGKIKPAIVRSAFWHYDRLVVVEDLPALVCTECHEQFYDDATVTILDLMRGAGFPSSKAARSITAPVFSFRDYLPVVDTENEGVVR
ncbi:MAG: type II toxin-antitoxin system MqsA family antitoxin [Devosia sp.]|nr:type II toxin-antitoxin system MqsA family antitoxin [Devosia sp.]